MKILLLILFKLVLGQEQIEVNKKEIMSLWETQNQYEKDRREFLSDLIEAQVAFTRDPQNKRLWTIENGVCIVGAGNWYSGDIMNHYNNIKPHYQTRISVNLNLYNVSNEGKIQIYLDNQMLKEYHYNKKKIVQSSLGPSNIFHFNQTVPHQILSMNITFKCDIQNQESQTYSTCGYSRLRILIDECSQGCLFCKGPEFSDCLKCQENIMSDNQSITTCTQQNFNQTTSFCDFGEFQDSQQKCQKCEELKFVAQLLENLNSMILISNQNFIFIRSTVTCLNLFEQETVDIFGFQPDCSILNSTHILVSFGAYHTINIFTQINIRNQYLISLNIYCTNSKFKYITSSTLNRDFISDGAIPYIIFTNKNDMIDICSVNSLNFTPFNIDKQCNFSFQLNNLDLGTLETSPIIYENYIKFPDLQASTHYNLLINMKNMLGISNQQNLIFKTLDPYVLTVQIFNITDQLPYYRYQQFQLRGLIQISDCTKNQTLTDEIINYSWMQIPNQTQENLTGIVNSLITSPKSLVIKPFTLDINQNYTFILIAKYGNKFSSNQISLQIQLADLFVFIEGGNRVNSLFDPLLLHANFINPNFDSSTVFENTSIQYQWSCISQLTNKTCKDSRSQPIIFNNSDYQYFPPKTFQITESIIFFKSNEGIAVIMITEVSIQPLSINIPLKVQVDRVSLNERLDFSINNTDTISISVGILYNFTQITQVFFNCPQFQLRLWNYITDIGTLQEDVDSNISLKIVVTSLKNQPQMQLIHLNINFPPKNCIANIIPEIGYELDTQFQILVNNCTDKDNGLNYRILFFEDYKTYNESFYDNTFQNKVVLQDFSTSNVLKTILPSPSTQNPMQTQMSYIVVSISDSKGAIKNITLTVTVLKQLNNMTFDKILPQTILSNYLNVQRQPSFDSSTIDPYAVYVQSESLLNDELPQYSRNQIFNTLYKIENTFFTNFSTDNIETSIQRINHELDRIGNQAYNVKNISLVSDSDDTPDKQQQNILNSIETHLVGISQYMDLINQGAIDLFQHNSSNYNQLNALNIQMVEQIDKIWNLSLLTLDPNQKRQFLLEKSFKMFSLSGSKELIEQTLGPILSDRKQNLFDQSNNRRLSIDIKNIQYFVKSVEYLKNPYYLDLEFPKNNTENTVIDIKIKAAQRTNMNILDEIVLNQDINLFFNIRTYQYQYNITSYCSQRQDNYSWSQLDCVLIQQQSYNNTTQVQCQCSKLNPTTIIAQKLENMFSNDSFEYLVSFNFTNTIIYWMLLLLILYFSVLTVYGWKQDEIDQQIFIKEQRKITNIISQIQIPNENQNLKQKEGKKQSLESLQEINENDENIQLRTTKHTMTIIPRDRYPKLSIKQATIVLRPQETLEKIVKIDRNTEKKRQKQKRLTDPKLIKLRELQRGKALQGRIQNQEISIKLALVLFIFKAHKMAGIITTFDSQKPRALRSVLYFQQILNILAITFFFGYEASVARSLVLIIFGTIFTRALYFFIDKSLFSKHSWLQKVGKFLIFTSLGVDIYIILGSIVFYANQSVANAWAQNYINWFVIDQLFLDPLILVNQQKIDVITAQQESSSTPKEDQFTMVIRKYEQLKENYLL